MRNHSIMPLNGNLVRKRLYDLGISERQAAKELGFSTTTMRTIVSRSNVSTALPLSDLRKLKEGLGVTWADLFTETLPDPPHLDEDPTTDVSVLVPVLIEHGKGLSAERLARLLEWDLERVRRAVDQAAAALQPLGLTVHSASSGYLIRSRTDLSDTHRRLAELNDDEAGIPQSAARVLYEAVTGTLSMQEDRNDHRVQLGRLHNLGALQDQRSTGGSRHTLSDETAFCLDF